MDIQKQKSIENDSDEGQRTKQNRKRENKYNNGFGMTK